MRLVLNLYVDIVLVIGYGSTMLSPIRANADNPSVTWGWA